ncbi:unnamed protein product [Caenorhabditis nigoni]
MSKRPHAIINPQLGRPARWEDLPIHFRLDVAKQVDPRSRECLRQVSQLERFAVDDNPITIRSLKIYGTPKKFLSRKKFCIEQHWESHEGTVVTSEKRANSNKIIDKLLAIFERKDIVVEEFMIRDRFMGLANVRSKYRDEKRLMEMALEFLKVAKERGITLRINHLRVQYPVPYPFQFLKLFDLLSMKSIMMDGYPRVWMDGGVSNELMEVPQWANLKTLAIEPMIHAELGRFHGIDMLSLVLQHLKPESIANLIKNFLTKQPSQRTCFIIKGHQIFENESFLRTAIQKFFKRNEHQELQYSPSCQLFAFPYDEQWTFGVFQKRERICGGFKLRDQDPTYNQFVFRLGPYN